MFITVTNRFDYLEEEEYKVCGYLQIDGEKPMKVHKIRVFKLRPGHHTIKYMSELSASPSVIESEFSREFSDNDVLNIFVYAGVSRVERPPEFEVASASSEELEKFNTVYLETRKIIEDSYNIAVKTIKENCIKNRGKFSDSFLDNYEKEAMEFLKTVDMRSCLAADELMEWTKHKSNSGTGSVPKNKWIAFLLCLFLGGLGAHKFYEEKYFIGVIYLFTFGLGGILVLVDLIRLLLKPNPYYVS